MSSIGTESSPSLSLIENGGGSDKRTPTGETAEISRRDRRTVQNLSATSLIRKRSDLKLISRVRWEFLRRILSNLQEVLLGTKLFLLFPAVPLAVVAHRYGCPRAWVFALSLLGLIPLAERISFLTEQIAFHTGPTVGGLMNATCGNATEMIIAILAVGQRKMRIVKLSLLGSILSNLLLVLGTSLFFGGLSNLRKHQSFDRRQGDMNCILLYLALLCQTLPMILRLSAAVGKTGTDANVLLLPRAEEVDTRSENGSDVVVLSRASSFLMLFAYLAFLMFHLFSARLTPPPPQREEEEDVYDDEVSDKEEEEAAVIGMWSAILWLITMTLLVALLSDYLVSTIQDAADSWGLSVGFIGIILLPIVGNAAEHAGAVIFAFRNKLVRENEDYHEWEDNGKVVSTYSTGEVYKSLKNHKPFVPWAKIVWCPGGIPKHNFMTWLFVLNRCPTRDRLCSWGLSTDTVCLLCGSSPETRDHLYFQCRFSWAIWRHIGRRASFTPSLHWQSNVDLLQTITTSAALARLKILAWQATIYSIWIERNHRLHRNSFKSADLMMQLIDSTIRSRVASLRQTNPVRASSMLQAWFASPIIPP